MRAEKPSSTGFSPAALPPPMTRQFWPRPNIRKIAEQGPCVIVGRGADYILRDFPHLVNVFLYAEKKDKVRYAMET